VPVEAAVTETEPAAADGEAVEFEDGGEQVEMHQLLAVPGRRVLADEGVEQRALGNAFEGIG
jgi:hypothetical protein